MINFDRNPYSRRAENPLAYGAIPPGDDEGSRFDIDKSIKIGGGFQTATRLTHTSFDAVASWNPARASLFYPWISTSCLRRAWPGNSCVLPAWKNWAQVYARFVRPVFNTVLRTDEFGRDDALVLHSISTEARKELP